MHPQFSHKFGCSKEAQSSGVLGGQPPVSYMSLTLYTMHAVNSVTIEKDEYLVILCGCV